MQGLNQRRSTKNPTVFEENFRFFPFSFFSNEIAQEPQDLRWFVCVTMFFERNRKKRKFWICYLWFWSKILSKNLRKHLILVLFDDLMLETENESVILSLVCSISLTGPIFFTSFTLLLFPLNSVIGAGVPRLRWGIRALNCRGFNSVMKIPQWISENWWICWWFLALMKFRVFWFVLGEFLFWSVTAKREKAESVCWCGASICNFWHLEPYIGWHVDCGPTRMCHVDLELLAWPWTESEKKRTKMQICKIWDCFAIKNLDYFESKKEKKKKMDWLEN